MRLRNKALIKAITPVFESSGFLSFKEYELSGFFVQKVSDEFYLCGEPVLHRFYDDKFTLDLYFANHLAMNACNYDMPFKALIRIGHYLSEKERYDTWNDFFADHWWSLYNADKTINTDVLKELEYLLITVLPRIPQDEELIRLIELSRRAEFLMKEEKDTITCYSNHVFDGNLRFLPPASVKRVSIPPEWYMAAQMVASKYENNNDYLIHSVPFLAKRSFCRYQADLAYGY